MNSDMDRLILDTRLLVMMDYCIGCSCLDKGNHCTNIGWVSDWEEFIKQIILLLVNDCFLYKYFSVVWRSDTELCLRFSDQWPVVSDECCWHVCLQCDVSAVRGERTLVTQVSVTMVASVSLCSVSTGSTGAALWSPQSTSLSPSSWMKWHGSPHPRGAGSSSVRVIRREAGTRKCLK